MTFEQAIAPIRVESFVQNQLDKTWFMKTNAPRHFESLISWNGLNTVLNSFRMPKESSRLRLVQAGKPLPKDTYLVSKHPWGSFLRAGAFERYLSSGATLVLDGVDEFFTEVRTLTASTETALRRYAWTNLYCGWGTEMGFDNHWDDHDTLILQVTGRKAWTVFTPTCDYPVSGYDMSWIVPTAPPIWSGVLEAGSLLYMPRGWWHYAQPLGEPTLHITIGLRAIGGTDVIAWLTQQLLSTSIFRQNAPLLADIGTRAQYITELRDALNGYLTGDCLDAVERSVDSNMERRTLVDLDSARLSSPALTPNSSVFLSENAGLDLTIGASGRLRIRSGAFTNESSPELLTCLSRLTNNVGVSYTDITIGLDEAKKAELKLLLIALFLAGRVVIRN